MRAAHVGGLLAAFSCQLAACGAATGLLEDRAAPDAGVDREIDAHEDPVARDAPVGKGDAQHASDAGDGAFDAPDVDDVGIRCPQDLSYIGAGDFRISLTMTTSAAGITSVVNQRAACDHGMFWDLRMVDGGLTMETDDGASYTLMMSRAVVNDGRAHAVAVLRTHEVLGIFVDGVSTASARSASSFAALPMLDTTSDVCVGRDGTEDFVGTLEDVCVTGP